MFKNSLFLVLSLIVISLFASDMKNDNSFTTPGNSVITEFQKNNSASKAPDFALKSVDGKTVKLSDFKGKIVIVDFWATWCPPCRKGIPDLIQIQKEYPKDVVVIGISLDRDTKSEVPAFVKNYGINYPVVYGDGKVDKNFGGIEAIPTAFVIDRNGNIVDKHVGLVPKSTYVNLIKKLK
ncbi:MAG: TlpA disulfide reductase family protein [Ignavibacteriaceae bacterium]|jgi:cytochrome c biogenesis protein CcmG/thiol:disulfide interchange protein DsbE|nr:TlpA disulfide reductase family protein [Ignavibacteriaceae bacterium]HPO56692.1 TlpA disulfide reductase family protein [Ignavibacteriaceae bacterium]